MNTTETKAEKIFRVLLATIGVTLIGVLFSFTLLQEEQWLKDLAQERITSSIRDIIQQDFSCTVNSINILTGEVVLCNIKSGAQDESWKFSCPTLTIKFSLADLIFKKIFNAQIHVYSMYLATQMNDGKLAIENPIQLFLDTPSAIPFKLSSLAFRQSCIEVTDLAHGYSSYVKYSCDTFILPDIAKTTVSLHDGHFTYKNKNYIERVQGNALIDINIPDKKVTVQTHISLIFPNLAPSSQKCNMHFTFKNDKGTFSLASTDHRVSLSADNITFSDGIAAAYSAHIDVLALSNNTGSIDITGNGRYKQKELEINSSILCNELPIASRIKSLDFSIRQQDSIYICALSINNTPALKATIVRKKDTTHVISVTSVTDIAISEVYVIKEFSCSALIDSMYYVAGNFKGAFLDSSKKLQNIQGTFTHNAIVSSLKSHIAAYEVTIVYDWSKQIVEAHVTAEQQKKIVNFSYDVISKKLQGNLAFGAIKRAIKYSTKFDVPGEGMVAIEGMYKDHIFYITTVLQKGTIRIPHTYNTIKDIIGEYCIDFKERKILINTLKVELHTGQLEVKHGACYFNEYFVPNFALITTQLHNCLGNWQKMFFGLFSGYLTVHYDQNKTNITGNIVIDKAQLKNNVLSPDVQKNMLIDTMRSLTQEKSNVNFNVQIATRRPAKVKTSFLETQAHAQVLIKGTFDNPHISGTVSLNKGILAFPYKPLYITEGKIYLNPEQLTDSSIEIIAKNTIKKYAIQMHVTGTLQSPHITFSSSPMLQEEQILTLLLAGSQEGSLFGVMPHMLMQGLEKALFSNAEGSSAWLQSLKNLLKPIGNIRINPTISDKQDGPVKGGIEIDVNDRLRASISNNLDLTDETSVELEYALSDDTTLRGTRDDKGNISGEIEMRWKF